MDELYGHVRATVADLPEITSDLTGTTSKGKPPPLIGGEKLAAVGPFNLDAPPDDFPHPLAFAYGWARYCAEVDRAIPPAATWAASLAYLRAHLHLIGPEDEAAYHGAMRRVHALLERLCNVHRKAQQEAQDDAEQRGREAAAGLYAWAHEIPPLYMLTRDDAELIWPVFAVSTDEQMDALEGYGGESLVPLGDTYWRRVRDRKLHLTRGGDKFPPGVFPAFIVREVADSVKVE